MPRRPVPAYLAHASLVVLGLALITGATTYDRFQPVAMTLGPATTLYFREPSLETRVHEAIHRRQMRDKTLFGRWASAVRYNFDYRYRLDEEAEAKAGELCLQINKFSAELPAYTTARSRTQAEAYRAWAWERIGVHVADRVGEQLQGGERCAEILRGVTLDLPPGAPLSERDQVRLATLRFLQSYGSTDTDVERWKARLALTGWADPVRWQLPVDAPDLGVLAIAQREAVRPDSAISPLVAGQALHRLTYGGARRMYAQLQLPLGGYRATRLIDPDEAREATGVPVEDWTPRLIEQALSGGLSQHALEYLERIDRHPVNADFETFARAPEADIVGARYRFPLRVGWGRLVLSDLDPFRQSVQAQYGRAALALARGDTARAETLLRTTLAGAVQLARNAPFEVDAIEGLRMALETLDGLERVLIAQGRDADVTWRDARKQRGQWAQAGYRAALFSNDPAVLFRALPALAQDQDVPYAFRRFAYRQVALFDVCLGRRRDPVSRVRHRAWTSAVEAGLAARPSDAELLESIRRTVRELLEASAVPPEQICAPATVAQPRVRVAIMNAPPVPTQTARADQAY